MRSPDFGIVAGLAILVLLCASLPYMRKKKKKRKKKMKKKKEGGKGGVLFCFGERFVFLIKSKQQLMGEKRIEGKKSKGRVWLLFLSKKSFV